MDENAGAPVGRRVVLGMLGLGVGGVLVGAKVSDAFSRVLGPVTARDPTGLTSFLPGRFRIYSVVSSMPYRSDGEYRLRVGGLVDRPMELTLADLKAMPSTDLVKDFQCVTGWRVRDVKWRGVLLSAVLDAAGARPGGKAVTFSSFDGAYTESLTIGQARRSDVIVAYEMDGDRRVSQAHGGPVRMYVAPMYGYKSTKWLSAIDVTADVQEGYWEKRGYDTDAFIGKSNGRDDQPVT